MARWDVMSLDEKIAEVRRLTRENMTPAQIAKALWTTAEMVRKMALREGVALNPAVISTMKAEPAIGSTRPNDMWAMLEADRRMAIHRRAQKAAAARLREIAEDNWLARQPAESAIPNIPTSNRKRGLRSAQTQEAQAFPDW